MQKNNRIILISIVIMILFSISGCKSTDEKFIAKVGNEGITEEEFEIDFEIFKGIHEKQRGVGALSQVGEDGRTLGEILKEDIVNKLIMEKIVSIETEKMNIDVTPDELAEKVEEFINLAGGQEQYDQFLETSGISNEYYKNSLRLELLSNKHKQEILKGLTIKEEDAKDYFENNKDDLVVINPFHILVKTEEEGIEVINRLNKGEDFAELAKEISIDKRSASEGGSLGYFPRGTMIADFDQVAFSLEVGEISQLVKTEVGYHVIYLADKKDTFDALSDSIFELLKELRYLEEMQTLRENSNVKILLDIKGNK